MTKTLIVGTSYIQGAASAETFRLWAELILRLNPGTDVLVVDSASPMELPYFPPPLKYLPFTDNIGHLSRGGQDGWGRAFSTAVTYAIDHDYVWLASVECDILFSRPVEEIFAKMSRANVKCCAPMAFPYQFTETGLSFWSVQYLKEIDLVGRYNWAKPPGNGLLPEQRIDTICEEDMFALPLRGFRNDVRWTAEQMQQAFPNGVDWVTHADLPLLRRFLEMNGFDNV